MIARENRSGLLSLLYGIAGSNFERSGESEEKADFSKMGLTGYSGDKVISQRDIQRLVSALPCAPGSILSPILRMLAPRCHLYPHRKRRLSYLIQRCIVYIDGATFFTLAVCKSLLFHICWGLTVRLVCSQLSYEKVVKKALDQAEKEMKTNA